MKKTIHYTALVLILFAFACKREIQVKIDQRPSVLVIDSELDPDSFLSVHVTQTQMITDNSDIVEINNAVVDVLDKDSVLISSLNYVGDGNYRSPVLKPNPSKRYLLRVAHQGSLYWADETMPDTFKMIFNSSDTSRGVIFQGKKNFFQLKLKIQDKVGDNFYAFRIKRKFKKFNGADTSLNEEWVNVESIDFILTENPDSRFSKKHLLFKDSYFNGLTQDFTLGVADLFNRSDQKTTALVVYISSYSENGYKYYNSVNQHLLYQNDPFSQPTSILGNVSGAYGAVTGSFNRMFEIKLP